VVRRLGFLVFLLAALASLPAPAPAAAEGEYVAVARLRGIINPPAVSYVDRTLTEAERTGAQLYVLELDTPGGLDSSMRQIVQRILRSTIPVVVYVWPPGARAGSAGVYIAYAAHVAAMAPNTNIGSATPVAMGEGGEARLSEEMRNKVTNDAVAYIRGLAARNGRNADWAERAVREAINSTESEALAQGVVTHVAADLRDLLRQLDGTPVTVAAPEGADDATRQTTIRAAGLPVRTLEMQPLESLLHAITDPTIAYLLLSLGMLALIYELSNPGAILPGVVGGVALLLALYALGTLPVNLAGLLLIAFAMVLFLIDLVAPSHGILTAGALVAFLLGSAILINTPEGAPFLAIAPAAIAVMTALFALLFGVIIGSVWRAHRRRPAMGRQGLLGRRGVAREPLNPTGLVWIDGELWTATVTSGVVPKGEEVEVVGIEGLHLRVQPAPRKLGDPALPARHTA
jgi:membrane-bound serine protease (ClpP class)